VELEIAMESLDKIKKPPARKDSLSEIDFSILASKESVIISPI
jgi:hypothetical protein